MGLDEVVNKKNFTKTVDYVLTLVVGVRIYRLDDFL
jgi:hypothetical protein